jgi:hypothetical protein
MGFFDRFRGSAARAEAAKPQPKPEKTGGKVIDLEDFFSPSKVQKDPEAGRDTTMIPQAEIDAARQKKESGLGTQESEKPSPVSEAKQDVLATYKSKIASWKPETIAAMNDFQERIETMEDSLFDFCEEVLDAETLTDSDKQSIEEVRTLSEKFLTMVEPFTKDGGIGGKDIHVRADVLRQTFQNVEKKLG